MRKLFLHVGCAKCGSTSLQAGLSRAPTIHFSTCGNHGGEHLAFALRIRGVDEWTRQYFDESWVEREFPRLMKDIHASNETVVLSSERLAGCSLHEIERIAEVLSGFDVQIVMVQRDINRYLRSTWRHAVYFHDYGESYEAFVKSKEDFSFCQIEEKFRQFFPVHRFNIDTSNFGEEIGTLFGCKLDIERLNVGVPHAFAELLQTTHALLGSEEFKKRFDRQTKQSMLAVCKGEATAKISEADLKILIA
ncbi:MAG: hypothetical protein WCO04_02790 [Pseudomonadota bacterium]